MNSTTCVLFPLVPPHLSDMTACTSCVHVGENGDVSCFAKGSARDATERASQQGRRGGVLPVKRVGSSDSLHSYRGTFQVSAVLSSTVFHVHVCTFARTPQPVVTRVYTNLTVGMNVFLVVLADVIRN